MEMILGILLMRLRWILFMLNRSIMLIHFILLHCCWLDMGMGGMGGMELLSTAVSYQYYFKILYWNISAFNSQCLQFLFFVFMPMIYDVPIFKCNSLTFTQCNRRPNILRRQFHLHVQIIVILKSQQRTSSEIPHRLPHLLHLRPPLLRPPPRPPSLSSSLSSLISASGNFQYRRSVYSSSTPNPTRIGGKK